jgi:Protein tyrosine and serine/threonine kinase
LVGAVTAWRHARLTGSALRASQVYKAVRGGVTTVAVKKMKLTSDRQREEFLKEVAILKGLRDGNIVQFLGACLQVGLSLCPSIPPHARGVHDASRDGPADG